ncbi:MAG: methyltransferase domain-containing protein [Verrucomicrobiales bacterium]|nr:methyltransferase domain-containing protein [Verrucomicrobiales bacterium]
MSTVRSSPESAYLGASGEAYHSGKRAVPGAALPWLIRVRAALFEPHIRPEHEVIEFGCGYGWNLGGLRCRRRVGHDIAPQLRPEVEALGVEFVASTGSLGDGSFDVAISHHSLEHVPEPGRVLAELHRLLKPGGCLLLAVPWERERRYRRYDPSEPNHHLYSWNPQTLGNLVAGSGFEGVQVGARRYGYDRRAALVAVRWGLGEAGFRGVRWALQRMVPLWEVVLEARRVAQQ